MTQTESRREMALRVHRLLLEYYGEPELKEQLDPLSELIKTILSQNTADVNSDRAYATLRERFRPGRMCWSPTRTIWPMPSASVAWPTSRRRASKDPPNSQRRARAARPGVSG